MLVITTKVIDGKADIIESEDRRFTITGYLHQTHATYSHKSMSSNCCSKDVYVMVWMLLYCPVLSFFLDIYFPQLKCNLKAEIRHPLPHFS